MIIKTITYQRVKNLGNYESERFEVTAELDDDDIPEAIAELKKIVREALLIPDPDSELAF